MFCLPVLPRYFLHITQFFNRFNICFTFVFTYVLPLYYLHITKFLQSFTLVCTYVLPQFHLSKAPHLLIDLNKAPHSIIDLRTAEIAPH